MRLRLNDQAVLCVEIMLDIASWVTQQIFAISMPAICHNRRTTTFYNFSTTFEAKRMAQEDTRRMKKISRIEYCAGFEPLQSGMEQDEGSRILLPTMKPIEQWFSRKRTTNRNILSLNFLEKLCHPRFDINLTAKSWRITSRYEAWRISDKTHKAWTKL